MGSSPRVRGKQSRMYDPKREYRLIPARAGKTNGPSAIPATKRAHPRACGENAAWAGPHRRDSGSSPRVRGKRFEVGGDGGLGRLIPARAGKTNLRDPRRGALPAHPRACGENGAASSGGWCPGGLIPARAGKTGPTPGRNSPLRAHPRACGENVRRTRGVWTPGGSSPRVRGKPSPSTTLRYILGLIPARAGKTLSMRCPRSLIRAHPRACGENSG